MTHITRSNKRNRKIKIDPQINQQIKDLHRQLVALSFAKGNHSEEYIQTLNQIHRLRNPSQAGNP